MWFAEQLDSFINLGICKEYPNMARSKSTSGAKANRTNTNKEQTGNGNPANIPDVKASAAEASPTEIASEPGIKPEPRKLEVVKSEPRKNVPVPINLVPINLDDEIRRRAYELYQQRGPASGSEAEDWLTAEREVRQRYHRQSA
jgi:hypothetical protein